MGRLVLINVACGKIEVLFSPCPNETFECKCREEIQNPFRKPSLTVKDLVYGSRAVIVE